MHNVALAADDKFVLEKFRQQFGGNVSVLQAAHFGQKRVRENRNIRLFQSCRREYIYDLTIRRNRFGNELPNRPVLL